jgi:hypothetical protein
VSSGARRRRCQFAAYEIGHFHLDAAEAHTPRTKAYLYVAVDRTSKLALASIHVTEHRPLLTSLAASESATDPLL